MTTTRLRQPKYISNREYNEKWYDPFCRKVLRKIWRERNVSLPEANDDVRREWELYSILEALQKYNPDAGTKFTTFLHIVAMETMTELRKEQVRIRSILAKQKDLTEDNVKGATERNFASRSLKKTLGDALDALPDEQRRLLTDRYFGRLTLAEMADERGCTIKQIRYRLKQAEERLAFELGR